MKQGKRKRKKGGKGGRKNAGSRPDRRPPAPVSQEDVVVRKKESSEKKKGGRKKREEITDLDPAGRLLNLPCPRHRPVFHKKGEGGRQERRKGREEKERLDHHSFRCCVTSLTLYIRTHGKRGPKEEEKEGGGGAVD